MIYQIENIIIVVWPPGHTGQITILMVTLRRQKSKMAAEMATEMVKIIDILPKKVQKLW